MKKIIWICKKIIRYLLIVIFTLLFLMIISSFITTPSNEKNWSEDQKILASAEIHGDEILIHNIRNFTYASTTSYTKNYYDKRFKLSEIKKIWYVVEPFEGVPGSAHTFLSFEFENNQFLAISIEIRKEQGESFSPLKGILNQYEIVYIIADENDVIKLRSNYRKDNVYLYPTKSNKEVAQKVLLDMLERSNSLKEKPEFYNTLINNCTTNIVKHINKASPKSIPFFALQAIFPAYSDKLAYKLGLIDTELPFENIRSRYLINEKAFKYKDDLDFSVKIREEN